MWGECVFVLCVFVHRDEGCFIWRSVGCEESAVDSVL